MVLVVFDFNRTLYDPDSEKLEDGAKELLATLKERGHVLALVGKGDEKRRELVKSTGIEDFFGLVDIRDEKDGEQFRKALDFFGETPENSYSIGDRARKEIKMSNAAGMKTIWLRKGKFAHEAPESPEEKPLHTVSSLKEILPLIK